MCAAEGYKKLAELLGYPNSVHLRRILEYIMTDKEAELVVSLPGTNDELAKKLNMTVEELKPLITDLYKKGVIVPKNFETLEGMRFIPLPIFFHDRVLAMKNWSTQLPKLAELWDNFLELDYFSEAAKQYAKGEQPIERVFAYYKTIENNPETLPEDDVRTVLKQARVIGVVPCACRTRTGGCKKTQSNVCMQFDRSAEYGLAVGMGGEGKALSYEEALKIVDKAEEAGLVHSWLNTAKMTGPTLCSCCSCCCIIGLPFLENKVPIAKRWAKSRFEAKVDPKVCIGCRKEPAPPCITACPDYFHGAIRMHGNPGEPDFKAHVNSEKCWGCGSCALKCPVGAIKMEAVRPPDYIPNMPRP